MRIKKSILAMATVVSVLVGSQSVSALAPIPLPIPKSFLETGDSFNLFDSAGPMKINLNDYYMGYLSGNRYTFPHGDWNDNFTWKNISNHVVTIKPYLFSPYGFQYRLFVNINGRSKDIYGEGQYKTSVSIKVQPGESVFIGVSMNQKTSYLKNYVLWINEVPINK